MPWCPKCRIEYRENYSTCTDCNSSLVEKLDDEKSENNHEAFLTTVYSDIEADMLESLLNSYKIPVLRKYQGAGGILKIYLGGAISPIDIFVPSELYDLAKDLIEAKPEPENEE